jgi:hypothetical protein
MLVAHVVVNHVHDHLDAAVVCFVHERQKLLVRAEAAIHGVHIRGSVAVIRAVLRGHVVLEDGRHPDGRHAEVLDVTEALADALEVAAVARVRVRAVHAFEHIGEAIVGWIAVREAVRHHQVDHILARKALRVRPRRVAGAQFERPGERALGMGEPERQCAGRRALADVQRDERVVRVGYFDYAFKRHAGMGIQLHPRRGDIGPVHHQLHGRLHHARPPKRRLDALDGRCLRVGRC